jgi:glyoxylase-like metal-dependent hydrolase (beta-lactamase superfamily II)
MRRSLRSLIPAFLLLSPVVSQAQASKVTSVEKVVDGVWMAQTDQGVNAGWILAGDEVIAVDAGNDAATAKVLLEKIQETAGKPVRYLVITHAHGDHAGGAAAFVAAGAQIVCSENAAPALAASAAATTRPRLSMLAFSERFAMFGAKQRVAIYFLGAAHTAGDIVVLLPDEKVLYSGDIALSKRAPYMQSPDVDPKGWENILARLAKLDIEKVVPGHGTLGTRQAIADTYGYVKKVNEVAHTLVLEKVSENLIEARLRRPDMELEASSITPELIANVRAVMRWEIGRPAATPAPPPKPTKAPAAKKK